MVNRLVRRLLALLILAALAAGCTTSNNGGNGTDGGGTPSPPAQMTTAQAQSLLTTAAANMPDRFGMTMSVTANGTEAMRMTGAFDNATGEAYLEVKGNASAFGEEAAQSGAQYLQNGISIYTTKQGSLYLANGTAFVFPPDESGGSLVPPPDRSPLSSFVDPTSSFAKFDNDTTVQSVTPTVYKGKPAVQLAITTKQENKTVDATVIVWTSPQRIAHLETTLPDEGASSPLSNAKATIDFAYDNDVTVTVPPAAKRAMGLGYKSNANPFGGGSGGPTVWTFQRSGGIALADVEVHVKDTSAASQTPEGMDYQKLPNLWTMKLSDKTKTEGGVTVTFDDKDGDSTVSANDTLTITSSGDEPPVVALYDTVTKTYVVPGAGVAVLLGAMAALAMLLRRK